MAELLWRRYTDLPSLIDILTHRRLTLLDPASWDDKNDSHFLSLYKQKLGLRSVLALCFTQVDETYHHWSVFSRGSAGVCISFDGEALIQAVTKAGARIGSVEYLKLHELRAKKGLRAKRLPFLKRYAFEPESEIRVLWESHDQDTKSIYVPIPLSAIRRVTLSPWLPPALAPGVKELVKSIDRCKTLDIVRSTLIGNAEWKKRGETAT